MTSPHQPEAAHDADTVFWRKSSFSTDQGACVEVAPLPKSRIAIRNSNYPHAGVLFFNRAEMNAFIKKVKAGKFDRFALCHRGMGHE